LNATSAGPATPTKPLSLWRLGAYSALQLPMAMAALPIVLNVSHFYGKQFAVDLELLGAIFLFTRALDAIQDPVLGYFSDKLTHWRDGRLKMAMASVPILALGFYGVFAPPDLQPSALLVYLTVMLVIAHFGYSGITISYQALGAELSYDYHERTRVTVTREVFGIAGLLLGSALPVVLTSKMGEVHGYATLALWFIPILIIPSVVVWFLSPRAVTPPVVQHSSGSIIRDFAAPVRNRRFRLLLTVYLVNGTSVAIAASVVLFFIDDVVGSKENVTWFILTYFGAGVLSVPAWLWVARRSSKSFAWLCGVVMSAVGLLCAGFLGQGDVVPYLFICALAGFGLGADYGIPPAILADVIHNEISDSQGESGKYFGLWAMATKLMTAIGGGIALPLLGVMGYTPNAPSSAWPLLVTYGLLPAAVKAVSAVLLWYIQVEAARPCVRDQVMGVSNVLKTPLR
jgi:glycoside/pentoside/hexuronide:cation symporter, GPH family